VFRVVIKLRLLMRGRRGEEPFKESEEEYFQFFVRIDECYIKWQIIGLGEGGGTTV